jgi:hypothetical protein
MAKVPVCVWCHKPITGRVYFQGGSRQHPSHKRCLVSVKLPQK